MSMEQVAQLLHNTRRLNIFAWVVLVVVPAVFLLGFQQLLRWKENRPHIESEMVLYLFLALAVIIPAGGLVIARVTKGRFRKGTSSAKTPWHLFLSISIFHMFMIYTVYVLAMLVAIAYGTESTYLLFYAVAVFWSLICWPRKRAYEKLQDEMKSAGVNR